MLSVTLFGSAFAQVSQETPVRRQLDNSKKIKPISNVEATQKAVIWSNDFSTAADWTETNTSSTSTGTWFWTTDVNAVPANGPANMTTASNGFYMVDSDTEGGQATQDAYLTYNGTVDLGLYPNVVLQFEQNYRTYQDERTVEVSTDGGTTWTAFTITDGTEANTNHDAPFAVNISTAAGGSNSVMIRFHYVAAWGWHWAVDDIEILEQPNDDVQLLSSWIVGDNNEGTEYATYMNDQVDANWTLGGEVFNFGVNDATNINLDMNFGAALNAVATAALLENDSTEYYESGVTPTLSNQVYTGTYTLTSTEETAGTEFFNKTLVRNIEVTDNLYAQDGVNVHPSSILELTSMGTDSFTDANGNPTSEDGFYMAAWYHIKNPLLVQAFEIGLANGTEEGAEFYIHFIDTTNLFNDDTSPFASAGPFYVTAADIAAGVVTAGFSGGVNLTPGCYYAAVEMYSNGGSAHMRILDDITVTQPGLASVIFIPGEGTYGNGESIAIRLVKGYLGVEEATLDGVSVYPNPSEGVITVTNDAGNNNTIEVFDVTGQLIATKSVSSTTKIDLTANGSGVYLVKVSNASGSIVERVVIK